MAIWIIFFVLGLVVFIPPFYFWRKQKIQIEQVGPKSETQEVVRVPDYNQTLPILNREYARARRHGRPLSVIVARPKTTAKPCGVTPGDPVDPNPDNTDSDNLNSSILLHCSPVFRDAVRETDITTFDWQKNRLIIALPDSNKEQTYNVVHRCNRILGDNIVSRLSVGIAEFPVDGLFIDELIDKAEDDKAFTKTGRKTNASKAIHSVT